MIGSLGHSGEWRNGRRAGFRCQCPSGRGGSSPPSPTTSGSTNCRHRGHELERVRDLCVWGLSLDCREIDGPRGCARRSPERLQYPRRPSVPPCSNARSSGADCWDASWITSARRHRDPTTKSPTFEVRYTAGTCSHLTCGTFRLSTTDGGHRFKAKSVSSALFRVLCRRCPLPCRWG